MLPRESSTALALPTSVLVLSTKINGHSNEDFHVFKKQASENAIYQSLNNPRMGFSVLYKMIPNEPGPVESETPGSEMEKIKSKRQILIA